MASARMCKAAFCFAASMLLCGAPLLAQEPPGAPGTPGGNTTNPSGQAPGSMPGNPSGTMPGSPSTTMPENSSMSAGAGKASTEDKQFMKTAMEGDMAEIQLAQLAQQKASSDQVKQFAQRMITDHTKLDAQMKPMAQQFGVEAPTQLDSKHKAIEAKLQALSGDQFDQEYIKAMVADHSEDDQAFIKEETAASSPDLKSAVTQAEPTIAEHLRMAQEIQKSIKGKSSSM
jgi:putative membrane protein